MENQGHNKLPNDPSAFTLGIVTLVAAFCCGIVSIVTGIIGIIQSNKSKKIYESDPDMYSEASYSKMKTAFILNAIGLALTIILTIISFMYMDDYTAMLEEMMQNAQ